MFRRASVICLLLISIISINASVAEACTSLTATQDDIVLFGNNEDYSNPNTYYWVVPSQNGTYGGVYFGFDDFWPQGGVNEMGLAFDINALPEAPLNPHPELPGLDNYEGYIVLQNCATVDEAIELLKKYNWGEAMSGTDSFCRCERRCSCN
jgi:penicillin V acylase-like amidase (Ntn superfamily)